MEMEVDETLKYAKHIVVKLAQFKTDVSSQSFAQACN